MKKLHFLATVAFVLLFSLSAGAATPKGHLVIVGGGGRTDKIGEAYVKYSGAPEAAFLVIGTASDTPMETAEKFAESIKKLGAGEPDASPPPTRSATILNMSTRLWTVSAVSFSAEASRAVSSIL